MQAAAAVNDAVAAAAALNQATTHLCLGTCPLAVSNSGCVLRSSSSSQMTPSQEI
jgi:hypothetical protein